MTNAKIGVPDVGDRVLDSFIDEEGLEYLLKTKIDEHEFWQRPTDVLNPNS